MQVFFKVEEFEIYPHSGELRYQNSSQKIRPRTCHLLTLLLEADGKIVSKETLINKIWGDVAVDDQVVFQSIKELRKLFQGIQVIKTHPRKGYSWILPIEKIPLKSTPTTKETPQKKYFISSLTPKSIAVIGMVVITIALSFLYFLEGSINKPIKGSIIVLPMKTTILDSDHRWVRFGAMDQLIHNLQSSDSFAVMQIEDVLDVMKRANMPISDFSRENINDVFQVSGASLVVEQTLTGSVRDYQLIYSLHQNGNIERGAVISESIGDVVNQLSQIVAARIGQQQTISEISYRSSFANEILASAIESLQSEEYDKAATLLQATITTEPDNLTAKRLLIQTLISLQKYTEADDLIQVAVSQAQIEDNRRELGRLRFWDGINKSRQENWNKALTLFSAAKSDADSAKDWLYLGYIAEASGQIFQARADFVSAESHFLESLKYHQLIQCPNGHANSLIRLGALALQQDNRDFAKLKFQEALSISEERHLDEMKKDALFWLAKMIKES